MMRIIFCLENGSLADVQVVALFAMGVFGFFLLQCKNDQSRLGLHCKKCMGQPLATLAVLDKFRKMGSHPKGSRLFRRIKSKKLGQMLKEAPMSYSRAGKLVKKESKSEGLDPSLYSLHIFRSWGASSAAALEIPDCLFQTQGRWRSN